MYEINKIYQKKEMCLICKVEFTQDIEKYLEEKMDICFSKVASFANIEEAVTFLRTVLRGYKEKKLEMTFFSGTEHTRVIYEQEGLHKYCFEQNIDGKNILILYNSGEIKIKFSEKQKNIEDFIASKIREIGILQDIKAIAPAKYDLFDTQEEQVEEMSFLK